MAMLVVAGPVREIYAATAARLFVFRPHTCRCLYLGSFADEAAAARVYDMAALMVRGPNTKLNFQNESYYDSSGKLVVDQHLHDVIQKHLQVGGGNKHDAGECAC